MSKTGPHFDSHAQTSIGDSFDIAHETAANVRTMGDVQLADKLIALRAEQATQCFGSGEMARQLCDHFRAEVWRLARL